MRDNQGRDVTRDTLQERLYRLEDTMRRYEEALIHGEMEAQVFVQIYRACAEASGALKTELDLLDARSRDGQAQEQSRAGVRSERADDDIWALPASLRPESHESSEADAYRMLTPDEKQQRIREQNRLRAEENRRRRDGQDERSGHDRQATRDDERRR